jgi:hypothetical protein
LRNPLISIIIPTRNRPDTLRIALSALQAHKSKSIEILVHDNASDAGVKTVVAEAAKADPRIVYRRSEVPLSQRANFEAAVRASSGDYITLIGDDDGFVMGALDWIEELLSAGNIDAIRWNSIHYAWPDLSGDAEGFARIFSEQFYHPTRFIDPEAMRTHIHGAGGRGSWEHVMIYHGLVARGAVDRLSARSDGVLFAHPMVDVWAHNLLAFHSDVIVDVGSPVSIYGTSGNSLAATWHKPSQSKARQPSGIIQEYILDEFSARHRVKADIRTLRYHDFRVLRFAIQHGVIDAKPLIRQRWVDAVLEEIERAPWQFRNWSDFVADDADDSRMQDAVLSTFAGRGYEHLPAPSRLWPPTYPEKSLLRVRTHCPNQKDDVEGAMRAIQQLTDDGKPLFFVEDCFQRSPPRFETPAQQAAYHRGRLSWLNDDDNAHLEGATIGSGEYQGQDEAAFLEGRLSFAREAITQAERSASMVLRLPGTTCARVSS